MNLINKLNINSYKLRFTRNVFCSAQFPVNLLLILILCFSLSCQTTTKAEDSSVADNNIKITKNERALFDAEKNIEKHRKGNARVKVLDSNGKAIHRAELKIKQISHDFKFGSYLKIDDLEPEKLPEYEKHFARLFNYSTIGTYWDFIENKQGIENWVWFEREVALAQKLGFKIQAAPVLWGTNQSGTPDWLPRDKNELLKVLEKHVKSVVTRNPYAIDEWEIVNEPLAPRNDVFARRIGNDYIESAFLWARQAAPNKRLLINESGIFGSTMARNRNRDKYFNLLKELIEKRVPFDAIGIQAHANGEWYEPTNVAEQLDRYAALGKPIQITEFSAQTLDYDDRKTPLRVLGTYRSGIWNEEKQAEFYREFYTICFANPQVEAIITWGLDDERAWLPGIGLIDVNGNAKSNYKILDRLINKEWRTNLELNLSANGAAKFRGFYGVYEIEVIMNGKNTKTRFELKKDAENEWIIQI